jgi:hypothetical protein
LLKKKKKKKKKNQVAYMNKESFVALMGPVRDILERNKANYVAPVPDNIPLRRNYRRGGISAESSERLMSALEWRPAVRRKSPASMAALEGTLGRSFLLKGLSGPDKAQLFDAMVPEKFSEGEFVIRQGEVGAEKLYVVLHGELDVYKDNFDGKGPVKVWFFFGGCTFFVFWLVTFLERCFTTLTATCLASWRLCMMLPELLPSCVAPT